MCIGTPLQRSHLCHHELQPATTGERQSLLSASGGAKDGQQEGGREAAAACGAQVRDADDKQWPFCRRRRKSLATAKSSGTRLQNIAGIGQALLLFLPTGISGHLRAKLRDQAG